MTKAVVLAPHCPSFAAKAKALAAIWHDALGPVLLKVHHIGSTAIQGLIAKPVLDLLPVVTNLDALDAQQETIEALGFSWHGPFGLPGRRYCKGVENGQRVHLHCYAQGNLEIKRHLAFRDYLRTYPDIAAAYGRVKTACATTYPNDLYAYGDCKGAWIKKTEADALDWTARQ